MATTLSLDVISLTHLTFDSENVKDTHSYVYSPRYKYTSPASGSPRYLSLLQCKLTIMVSNEKKMSQIWQVAKSLANFVVKVNYVLSL